MQLVSFSVSNFRSITTAYKLPICQSTILIGPNNEGKSNILKALVTALELLGGLSKYRIYKGRLRTQDRDIGYYDWDKDYPISLQIINPNGESTFNLEFQLSPQEIAEFDKEVKSTLNGNLQIQLTLGKGDPGFKVIKRGPGAQALSKKADAIAQFISKRISIAYIPAIRTSEQANDIVEAIVERELLHLEKEQTYRDAVKEISKIQTPVLTAISKSIKDTLKVFLPNVRDVKVRLPEEVRFRPFRRMYEVIVDDGNPTALARKGDGAQSLAALSLMRYSSEKGALGRQLILAIEEPESHLHPSAIHGLKNVIADIAQNNQVIMTTHCPVFVDRIITKSNIIVSNGKANPACNINQIRDILGVHASDNLSHANIVLLVEGDDDKRAISSLFKHYSTVLRNAIAQGTLTIDTMLGGANLSYKLSQLQTALCITYSFLDHDLAGKNAAVKAITDNLASAADITYTTCLGMRESEIEDLYNVDLYSQMLQQDYGVSTLSPKFKGNRKWSDRLRDTFTTCGKTWSDQIEGNIKLEVAKLVEASPGTALCEPKRVVFDTLITTLEQKIKELPSSKKK